MVDFEVRVAPRAQAQLDDAAAWWRMNRPAAPTLPLGEFEAALLRLRHTPASGANYRQNGFRLVRRVLLPRSRYHVYYTVDEATRAVNVIGFWHATRRRGPRL
jgi:plasmid stabilization system protein ParE